jgi:hypothetical protein
MFHLSHFFLVIPWNIILGAAAQRWVHEYVLLGGWLSRLYHTTFFSRSS